MYGEFDLTLTGAQSVTGTGNLSGSTPTSGKAKGVDLTSDDDRYDAQSEYNQIMKKVDDLGKDLQTVDSSDDISNISAKITSLKANISIYTAQISELKSQIEKKEKELETVQKDLEKERKTLEDYKKAFEEKEEEIKEINDKIAEQERIIENADKNTPEGLREISQAYSVLADLNTTKSDLLGDANTLDAKIQDQENTVAKLETKESNLTTLISALKTRKLSIETQKQNAEAQIQSLIVKLIPEKEKNIANEQNLDLTEKLPDGTPRYIIAQGKQDGNYHIYDLSTGASLARQYCEDGGYDIIPNGNGYISISQVFGDEADDGLTCYYLDSCDSVGQFNACYCTSSPLSLDVSGKGISTTSKVINYDIDGDGIMDQINNSNNAVLVFDKDGDGISGANGSECFGDNTDLNNDGVKDGFKNGFEALKALAQQNNLINGTDDNVLDLQDIAFLEQNYGLRLKVNGYDSEAKLLSELGITEINLAETEETTVSHNFDGRGNTIMQQQGATFTMNGEEREYADIWHKKLNASDIEKTNEIFGANTLSFNIAGSHTVSINQRTSEINTTLEAASDAKEKAQEAEQSLDDLIKEKQDAKKS